MSSIIKGRMVWAGHYKQSAMSSMLRAVFFVKCGMSCRFMSSMLGSIIKAVCYEQEVFEQYVNTLFMMYMNETCRYLLAVVCLQCCLKGIRW